MPLFRNVRLIELKMKMSKLILMQGLPASGKSTRACQLLAEYGNAVRINRDLLRTMLHNDVWSGKKEDLTFLASTTLAKRLLEEVGVVIIDDTNLNPHVVARWRHVAQECNVQFEVMPMCTDVQTCLLRDEEREKPVGSHVIIGMAMQYGLYPIPKAGFVICDIDGTLADVGHRLHYIRQEPKDWHAFFEAAKYDPVRQDVVNMLHVHLRKFDREIILVSGRPDKYRKLTESWLFDHVPYTTLFMRRDGDHRPDTIVKEEILKRHFPDTSTIVEVIDDRPSVISMWRSHGLKVVDVGDGEEF